jgi:hypothetical protein
MTDTPIQTDFKLFRNDRAPYQQMHGYAGGTDCFCGN